MYTYLCPRLKHIFLFFSFFLIQFISAQIPTVNWAKQIDGAYVGGINAIANDPNGYVYAICGFSSKISIGSQTVYGTGNADFAVIKSDAAGTIIWAKLVTSGIYNYGSSMVSDAQGNIYIAGSFSGHSAFGATVQASAGSLDAFVLKMDPNGNVVWSEIMGGTGADYGMSVDVDGSGNVYTHGSFEGTANFAGLNLSSSGSNDMFVMKNNAITGTQTWVKKLGGNSDEMPGALCCDVSGNIFVTGSFSNTGTFDAYNFNSSGNLDVCLLRLDPANGAVIWAQQFGGNGADQARGICVDSHGDVYSTGDFSGVISYGSQTLVCLGLSNPYFLKNNGSSGNAVFVKSFVGNGQYDYANVITCSGANKIYLGGSFTGNLTLGNTTLISLGGADMYLCEADTLGTILWTDRKGGINNDSQTAINTDFTGNLYTGGYFAATVPYGPVILSAPAGTGAYIARWGSFVVSVPALNEAEFGAKIYPNPFFDTIKLSRAPVLTGTYLVSVINSLGEVVLVKKENSSDLSLNLSHLKSGIYFLRIEEEGGRTHTSKIIKE